MRMKRRMKQRQARILAAKILVMAGLLLVRMCCPIVRLGLIALLIVLTMLYVALVEIVFNYDSEG